VGSTGHQVSNVVAQILKGAPSPAEPPIKRPIKFELVINLKTAQGARPSAFRWRFWDAPPKAPILPLRPAFFRPIEHE